MFNYTKVRREDKGFSLLELVVAVGVLLILTLIGLLAYNGITNNARQAAVNNAADDVYKGVMTRMSGVEKKDPLTTGEEWMNSAGENNKITVIVEPTGNGQYKIEAWYGDEQTTDIKAERTTLDTDTNSPTVPDEDNDGDIIGADPLLSTFTFVCDNTTTGILPITNIDMSNTEVLLINGSNTIPVEYSTDINGFSYAVRYQPATPLANVSVPVTLNAGVSYTLQIDGTFENIALVGSAFGRLGDCLTAVDSLGEESGLKHLGQVTYNPKIQSVPNDIPPTVVSLANLFQFHKNITFGDNLANWDVSNVESIAGMFDGASISGDLDLSGWDTSSVKDANYFLQSVAVSGELDISGLELNNVTIFMGFAGGNGIKNLKADNLRLNNVTASAPLFSNLNVKTASLNKWEIKNSSFSPPLINTSTINGDLNNWKISDSTMNSPIVSGTINGNADNWELANINETGVNHIKKYVRNGNTITGSMGGWTLDGSPM